MFKIIDTSWCKRRAPTKTEKELVNFEVIDFKKIEDHCCKIMVEYNDGSIYELAARVHVNKIHFIGSDKIEYGRWTVNGINAKGISLLLEVLE